MVINVNVSDVKRVADWPYLHLLSSSTYFCTITPYLAMLLEAMYLKLKRIVMVLPFDSMRMRVDWSGVNTKIDTRACRAADSGGVP